MERDPALETLKRETRALWDATAGRDLFDALTQYIENLLPKEMEFAAARKRLQDPGTLPGGRCERLALLVGFSLEPLLQAIYVYRPAEVVPVLNRQYSETVSGVDMRRLLARCVEQLKEKALLGSGCSVRCVDPLSDDSPPSVFRFLLEKVGVEPARTGTVIDITGGKKSMVAGAFVFAAYTGTAISYVDFDEYDQNHRRPYGCTCRIGTIENPYRRFSLHEWSRVQRLYEVSGFRAAREILARLIAAMADGGYFEQGEVEAVRRLAATLEAYEYWENGDYHGARDRARALPEGIRRKLPGGIEALGDRWPHAEGSQGPRDAADRILAQHRQLELGDVAQESTFYVTLPLLATYVQEELGRIERLVRRKEDYRSALLRADGLGELLLNARLLILWKTGKLRIETRDGRLGPQDLEETQRRDLYARLTEGSGSPPQLVAALRWKLPGNDERVVKLKAPESWNLAPGAEVSLHAVGKELEDFWSASGIDVGRLRQLRNKASHTYLSIPRSLAEAALAMARSNWEDFVRRWASRLDPGFTPEPEPTGAMPWWELCAACGVDFVPLAPEETRA